MKDIVIDYIKKFVADYERRGNIQTEWGEPIVGFADAKHPSLQRFKDLIGEHHALPRDVVTDARIVVAYFIPFTRELAKANCSKDIVSPNNGWEMAVPAWARAYEETNAMFGEINAGLVALLQDRGYHAAIPPQAGVFDKQHLVSDWSQRHFAYLAGLGTFGLNNMLITKHGCCGRYSSVVTNLDVTPDRPINEDGDPAKEYCLYKRNGSCGVCVKNCPSGALQKDGYDRHKCYEVCLENAKIYSEFGSEVCGKCVTGSPCAFWKI